MRYVPQGLWERGGGVWEIYANGEMWGWVQLVIPKFHGAKLTDIPDEDLGELLVGAVAPLGWGERGEGEGRWMLTLR